jgi:Putative auto-transporter adhesin, head GIN domain
MSTATRPRRGPRRIGSTLGVLLLAAILGALAIDRVFFHGSSPPGTGSGAAATQVRTVHPFTGVALTGANNVIVHVGGRQSVIVHADSNLLGRVTTRVRAGRLVIGTTPGNLNAKSPMFVVVTTPSLDAIALPGAGNINATGIAGRTLTATLAGSGNLEASGATAKLDVTIGGEGTALMRSLTARDARAVLSGSGTIMLTATHSLTATVSGSGSIFYGGNPGQVTPRVTGSGTISPG